MIRNWSGFVVAGAVAATVGLAAQNSPNPANTPPPNVAAPPGVERAPEAPSAQQRTPNTITVTGCIANAPMTTASADVRGSIAAAGADAGNRGAAGRDAAGAADRDAARAPGARADAGAGVDVTAGGATSVAAPRFVLSSAATTASGEPNRSVVGTSGTVITTYQLDGDVATISPHLNHRVEITGRLQSSAASPTGAANAAAGSTAAGPTLRVESVRMLAETCDPAGAMPATTTPNRNPGQGNPGGNRPPQQ